MMEQKIVLKFERIGDGGQTSIVFKEPTCDQTTINWLNKRGNMISSRTTICY